MAMRHEWEVQGPRSPGHAFYDRLQTLLAEAGFDRFVETTCKPFYAPLMGAPSLPPGRYFRMHMIDTPPLKWSALRYAFWQQGGRTDAEEETQAGRDRGEAASGRGSYIAGSVGCRRDPVDRHDRGDVLSLAQEFRGLKSDQVKRLKELGAENARLRRAVSDLTLDKLILQGAARGNY